MGTDKLDEFSAKHADAKKALDVWLAETRQHQWKTPQDIRNRYRTADFLSGNRVIFNIKGNHYRLAVEVLYQDEFVFIEWIGTHAQYSKKKF